MSARNTLGQGITPDTEEEIAFLEKVESAVNGELERDIMSNEGINFGGQTAKESLEAFHECANKEAYNRFIRY